MAVTLQQCWEYTMMEGRQTYVAATAVAMASDGRVYAESHPVFLFKPMANFKSPPHLHKLQVNSTNMTPSSVSMVSCAPSYFYFLLIIN